MLLNANPSLQKYVLVFQLKEKQKQVDPWEAPASQTSPFSEFQANKRLYLKKQGGVHPRNDRQRSSASPRAYAQVHKRAHTQSTSCMYGTKEACTSICNW